MTTQIHFFSPSGYMPMKDQKLKMLTSGSHGFGGHPWVFGVVEVRNGVHPADVRDCLVSLGVVPLPACSDTDTKIDPQIVTALAEHGVLPSDHTRAIAQKMGKLHPLLRLAE